MMNSCNSPTVVNITKNIKHDVSKNQATYQNSITENEKYSPYPKQKQVGEKLYKTVIKNSNQISKYTKMDLFVLVPSFLSLEEQNLDRVSQFIELVRRNSNSNDVNHENFMEHTYPNEFRSYVNDHIIKLGTSAEDCGDNHGGRKKNDKQKFNHMIRRINTEKDTLFQIIVDEAHYGITPKSDFNAYFNKFQQENVIIIMVTATPYSLLTKNSRINPENVVNWYENGEEEKEYYGVNKFYEANERLEEESYNEPSPGAMSTDNEFESMVAYGTKYWKRISQYVDSKCKPLPSGLRKSDYEENKKVIISGAARLSCLICQHLQMQLKLSSLPEVKWRTLFEDGEMFTSWPITTCSEEIAKTLINNEHGQKHNNQPNGKQYDETGTMNLVRVLSQGDGKLFYETIFEFRRICKLENVFSIVIDIEEGKKKSGIKDIGMKGFNKIETQFLQRLRRWKCKSSFLATKYTDLCDIPIILIVVDKGKMGITYPPSLKWYDLRLRYTSSKMVTRTAFEQDIGRACRYINEKVANYQLPTILISKWCHDQIASLQLRGRKERGGVKGLEPDYPTKMARNGSLKSKGSIPETDIDFSKYREHWTAGTKNYDYQNTKWLPNRYLLVGKQQIGKTGAFLHYYYVCWLNLKAPTLSLSVSDIIADDDIIDDDYTTEDDDEEANVNEHANALEIFPQFDKMFSLHLKPKYPASSSRYGNPSLEKDRDHYLVHRKTYPPKRLLEEQILHNKRNKLLKRASQSELDENSKSEQRKNNPIPEDEKTNGIIGSRKNFRKDYTKFGSLPLVPSYPDCPLSEIKSYYNRYDVYEGSLYLHKKSEKEKWDFSEKTTIPIIKQSIILPPIVMCSSGRAETGLFDLKRAMDGEQSYIQIIVIREEEKYSYFKLAYSYYAIDLYVIPSGQPHMVGTARKHAKEMSSIVFENRSVIMLDDNIRGWSAYSTPNDKAPLPMITNEPSKKPLDEDISLRSVLEYIVNNKEEMSKFALLGFQTSKRGMRTCKNSFTRQHVFAAVIINLMKTKQISYHDVWAMEDIDFNVRLDDLWDQNHREGVIVKIQRIIVSKKSMLGGVTPYNVPPDLELLMKSLAEWKNVKIKQTNDIHKYPKEHGNIRTGNEPKNTAKRKLENEVVTEIIIPKKTKYREENGNMENDVAHQNMQNTIDDLMTVNSEQAKKLLDQDTKISNLQKDFGDQTLEIQSLKKEKEDLKKDNKIKDYAITHLESRVKELEDKLSKYDGEKE